MSGPQLSSRQRGVVGAVLAVVIVAAFAAYGGVLFFRAWTEREERIALASDQLGSIASLIATEDTLSRTVSNLERTRSSHRQLLTARTPSLAASELQRILRLQAERSKISIDRLEFSSDQVSDGATVVIPFTISAVGDIYGIPDFLAMLRNESPVLEISEMNLVSNTALKAGLVQFSATVRAPVLMQ